LAALGTILALLVVIGSAVVLKQPPEFVAPGDRIAIDPANIKTNTGFASLVVLDLSIPSDNGGESQLGLLEDGVPLTPHALHQTIRERGEGRFSHWGKNLYFSSTDGSDPRDNGKRYELHLPVAPGLIVDRARQARSCLLISSVLAVALCLLWRGSLPAQGTRLLLTAAVVVLAFTNTRSEYGADEGQPLAEMAQRLKAGGDGASLPSAHASDRPRTTRLLNDGPSLPFAIKGQPLTLREPLAVPLVPSDCADVKDGVIRLEDGCVLVSEGPLAVAGDTLAEMIFRARVLQGTEVRFTFHDDSDATTLSEAQLILPVQPNGEWQTIRVSRPLNRDQVARWLISGKSPITRIELGPTKLASEALVLEIEPLRLSDAMAVYTRSTHGTDTLEIDRTLRPAVWQSTAGEFELPWPEGAGARLRGSVASLAAKAGVAVSYDVAAVFADGSRETVASGAAQTGSPWQQIDVDLAPLASRHPTGLVIGTEALPHETILAWSSLRLIDTTRPARHVVLLLVDTLRADALACLGNPKNATPVIDALAAEGALFERCYAQAYWTRPSVPSIMASRYVRGTGVHSAGLYLPDSYDTLAEHFSEAGFFSVGFVSNAHAGPAAGLIQGLDEMILETNTDDTDKFLRTFVDPRLDTLEDEDIFAWIHLMEVHGPYGPFEKPADFEQPQGQSVPWDDRYDRKWNPNPTAESRRALYGSDLENMDIALGRFMDERIAAWDAGPGPDTVIALAADHGEFLGEYDGTWGHEWNRMLPESVHVPLIVRAPGRIPASSTWSLPVENIDIGPTLLDLAGVQPWSPGMERPDHGRSLVPLLDGTDTGRHGDLAISAYERGRSRGAMSVWDALGGTIAETGKVVGTISGANGTMVEWHPGQPATLAEVGADLSRPFGDLWEAYLDSQAAMREAMWASQAGSAEQSLDAESLAQMQALGYLGR